MAPGQHTFEVRAVDMAEPLVREPEPNPNFEGNADPTPATYTWTMTADTTPPGTGILSGPAERLPGRHRRVRLRVLRHRQRHAGPRLTFECSGRRRALASRASSPDSGAGPRCPGQHTFRIRAIDLAVQRRPDAGEPHLDGRAAADHDDHLRARPAELAGRRASAPARTRSSPSASDQPGSTFECVARRGRAEHRRRRPLGALHLAGRLLGRRQRRARVRGPGDQPGGRGRGAAGALRVDRRARARHDPARTRRSPRGPPAVDQNTVATFEFTGSDNRAGPT